MLYFAFCIHNHQPAGNFDGVLHEAYEKAYGPFLTTLSKHPSIKLTLHTSGFLLDWLVENKPEYIALLKSMTVSGQVEIMGGGYYEPILAIIPECDRLGQIRALSDRIKELFGVTPRGVWLAERVWEPSLASTLNRAGVEYLLVDDYHFIKSGVPKEELGGYYMTEDQGLPVKVLPGSETLRYMIPFQEVDKLSGYLSGLEGFLRKGKAAIYGDDGEKFGSWPGTHKWVYDEGWLEAFFQMIESLDWVQPVTLSQLINAEDNLGRVYLPTTSYMEMGEWALPHHASKSYTLLLEDLKAKGDGGKLKEFMQGGIWRNFLAKYPESNWMHKRMLLASRAIENAGLKAGGREADEAKKSLYMAQCNDAYWHGVFGGLYLPHLRTEVYANIIKAERVTLPVVSGVSLELADFDADGHDEAVLKTKELNLFFCPSQGGALFELDYKPKAVNVLNTLTRWPEAYHHKIEDSGKETASAVKTIHDLTLSKEDGLNKVLKTDKLRRGSFIDRFLKPEVTLEDFSNGSCSDEGGYANGRYEYYGDDDLQGFSMSRWSDISGISAFVTKRVRAVGENAFSVSYRVDNDVVDLRDDGSIALNFAVEFNVLLPACDGPACRYEFTGSGGPVDVANIGLGSVGELQGIQGVRLIDTFTGVEFSIVLTEPMTLWRFPVYTVSLSEAGFEKIYQASCLVFLTPVELNSQASAEFSFNVTLTGC
ncbi:DUF1926 domain-containing protein [bacterium]|nr:MAG: DUF1926 domain-containing protein [bacterium]